MRSQCIALFLLISTTIATASPLSFAFGVEYDDFSLENKPILIQTTDQGSNWTSHFFNTSGGLAAGACNQKMCVVLGNNLILQSFDNGTTWQHAPFQSDTSVEYVDADCNEDLCVAIGYHGTAPILAQTTNGGAYWSTVPLRGNIKKAWLHDVSCAEHYCAIAAESWYSVPNTPLLLQTSDAGKSWEQARLPLSKDAFLNSVDCNSETCVAAGGFWNAYEPVLLQTDLNNIAWYVQTIANAPKDGAFLSVGCAEDICAVSGSDDSDNISYTKSFIATNENGRWASQDVFFESGQRLESIACNDIQCFAAGDMKTKESYKPILLSNLYGTWKEISFPSFPQKGALTHVSCSSDLCIATGRGESDEPLLVQGIQSQPWELVTLPVLDTKGILGGGVAG